MLENRDSESGLKQSIETRRLRVLCFSVIFLTICMLLTLERKTWAAGLNIPDSVKKAGESIVRIKSVCTADTKILKEAERTGFLVGTDGGEPYIITSSQDLILSEKELKKRIKKSKLDKNAQISTQLYLVFQGDIKINLSVVGTSEQKNLAILKSEQTITNKYSMRFADSAIKKGEDVYLLSFPIYPDQKENYSQSTVTISKSKILHTAVEPVNDTHYFYHNVEGNEGNLGAPFVDKKGNVIGMLVGASSKEGDETHNNRIALTEEEILKFMDLHNLGYTKAESPMPVEKKQSYLPLILGVITVILLIITVIRMIRFIRRRQDQPEAFLVHTTDGEKVPVKIPRFVIGSSAKNADYAVAGNRKVSRIHAAIIFEKGVYYIEDQNSKNGTFVNGKKLDPGIHAALENGSDIRLADEQFLFEIR